ncbi:hypothetical protein ACLOJK_020809 [Asimina triloba]
MVLEVQQQEQRQHLPTTSTSCGREDSRGDSFFNPSSAFAALHRAIPNTLNRFHPKLAASTIELDEPSPLPSGWQRCLNLRTGAIYYTKEEATNMSWNARIPKLELKLNLSPPRWPNRHAIESPNSSLSSSLSSSPSSCMSTELNLGLEGGELGRCPSSPDEATSMVLVGCPRCFIYVMLSEDDPKCPKCKSTVLLDFHDGKNSNTHNEEQHNKTNKN